MARLEDLTRGAAVQGVLPDGLVTVTARQGDRVARTILRRAGGLSDAEIERERGWVAGLEVI